jgi:hypothetical protein
LLLQVAIASNAELMSLLTEAVTVAISANNLATPLLAITLYQVDNQFRTKTTVKIQ